MAAARECLIWERAYAIWKKEGCPEGLHVEHWLRAEVEIDEETNISFTDDGKKVKLPSRNSNRQRR